MKNKSNCILKSSPRSIAERRGRRDMFKQTCAYFFFLSLSFILLALTSLTVIERGVRTIQLVFRTLHQWVLSHTRPFKLLRQRKRGRGF